MDSELPGEVIQGVKAVAGVKALLILAVAALDLAVVARGIGTDKFMPDSEAGSSCFEQGGKIPLAVGEAIGKFKAVIRLDTFHADPSAGIPLEQLFQKIRGGIGRLLRVGGQEAQTGKLVNGGVLEQAKLRICNTAAGNDLHIYLHALSGTGHLLVRLGFVCIFRLFGRKQPHFAHDTEQTLWTAGVAALPQTVPQLDHAQRRIAAAHIADEL